MINNVSGNYNEGYSTVERGGSSATVKEMEKTPAHKAVKSESEQANCSENKKEEQHVRKLKEAINQANQEIRMKQTACEFSYDEDTNRIAIKVKDKETDEVIREIPAEETLEMLARIREQAGLLMDERR